eukprot:g29668.t1
MLTIEEIVALSGAHGLGACHTDRSGFWGPWTRAPTTVSNEYYRELLENTWTIKTTHKGKPWKGPLQFEDPTGDLMMLPSDLVLIQDWTFRKYVEMYAKEWFFSGQDKPNACTRVCFKEQGDAIPAGRDKEFQDYLAFLLKVQDKDEGTSAPLLCNGACTGYCKAEAMETLQEVVIEVADESAEAAGRKLDEMMKKAEDQLGVALKHIDATMKPHVQALRQIMANNKFKKVFGKLAPEQQKALLGTITVLGKTEKGKTFAKGVKQFEDELKKLEGEGMSPFVTKLVDSQLQAATGYSSGELFAFLKVSPAQMASDMHELEDISGYVEKLQETVNVNNWDDIVENFLCLYDLQFRLKGERSRKVFATIWKDETLRKCVAVGRHFQHVTSLNDPPAFVLHMVKYASTIVKKGAVGWKLAMKKEMTAIDLMKSRQQAFFQFMISCITGFFVFVATFFSGLLLDAAKSGRVSIPYFSNFLISFNSTDAV